jgi:hypothetical protein
VSKQAGKAWGDLDTKVRKKYHVLADERKRLHTLQYPDYTYNPVGRGKKRKADEEAKETIPFPSSPIARPSKQARLSPIRSSAPSPEFEPTPDLSPNTPSESSDANLSIHTPEDTSFRPEMTSGDDFIPTADIPPLDLYAKEEVCFFNPHSLSLLKPPVLGKRHSGRLFSPPFVVVRCRFPVLQARNIQGHP